MRFFLSLPHVGRFRVTCFPSVAPTRSDPTDLYILAGSVLLRLHRRSWTWLNATRVWSGHGTDGCGKTTTLAALINRINESRAVHILTLEDPIEYLHRTRRASSTSARSGQTAVPTSRLAFG
jgi:twitching motility protein PilT